MDVDTSLAMKRGHPGGSRHHAREKIRREEQEVIDHDYNDEGGIIDKEDDGGEVEEDDEKGKAAAEEDEKQPEKRKQKPQSRNDVIISQGSHSVEGKMKHGMEDFLVAKTKRLGRRHKLGLYAIFDGHSGKEVAEYLQGLLFVNILKQREIFDNPKFAVSRAYKETDAEILENVVGSTSLTAIVVHEKKQLIVAHVGDSRAVVCRNGKGFAITRDHSPERERDLVESKGGFVSKKPVDGQLAMSRAFGDAKVKEHITAEPTIYIEKIDEDMEYLILASDGLWKVMSNQDAVDCIKGMKEDDVAAKALVEEAVDKGSRDDISCVVGVLVSE